jgi:hypothetical protein
MFDALTNYVGLAEGKVSAKWVFELVKLFSVFKKVQVGLKIFEPKGDIELNAEVGDQEAGSLVVRLAGYAKWAD